MKINHFKSSNSNKANWVIDEGGGLKATSSN
jgi:hypothetical protein